VANNLLSREHPAYDRLATGQSIGIIGGNARNEYFAVTRKKQDVAGRRSVRRYQIYAAMHRLDRHQGGPPAFRFEVSREAMQQGPGNDRVRLRISLFDAQSI